MSLPPPRACTSPQHGAQEVFNKTWKSWRKLWSVSYFTECDFFLGSAPNFVSFVGIALFSKLVNKVVPRRVNWTIFTTFVCTWHHSPCTFACFVSWQNSVWGRRYLSFFFLHALKVTFFLGNFLPRSTAERYAIM